MLVRPSINQYYPFYRYPGIDVITLLASLEYVEFDSRCEKDAEYRTL